MLHHPQTACTTVNTSVYLCGDSQQTFVTLNRWLQTQIACHGSLMLPFETRGLVLQNLLSQKTWPALGFPREIRTKWYVGNLHLDKWELRDTEQVLSYGTFHTLSFRCSVSVSIHYLTFNWRFLCCAFILISSFQNIEQTTLNFKVMTTC